ncbi:MAG TPA: hypothetical protein VD998_02405 [Verrucomicrobiae bacterium]|nr:hypothetical protein [Verrucomicrobiae bacterium]
MNKLYSQLPTYEESQPPVLEKRHLYGFVFLFVVFGGLIFIIYNWQYGRTNPAVGSGENESKYDTGVCIQVITPARNPFTGEIKEFPTPCDVPEGWERIRLDVKQ